MTAYFIVDTKFKPVICLMGPTACGKTQCAIDLLSYFDLEIISVDSAMIYRGMDIGTAKPSPLTLKQAPHRLINTHDPSEVYSAAEFRSDAINAIDAILNQGRIPLLVGGTMLYFHVLQQGIDALPAANFTIRQQLKTEQATLGLKKLHERLSVIDPIAAQRIHPHDSQRIFRALEVAQLSGNSLTALQTTSSNTLPYYFINIALFPNDRYRLHQTIADRFQTMLAQGFLEEVETLFKRDDLHTDLPAIRTVGYRHLWNYLQGTFSYAHMKDRAIIATRQLAKRQLTWLRSWKTLNTFACYESDTTKKMVHLIKTNLKNANF
ncbi:tRNA delta(2)-isopentenylpyrophosphate transferase [Rickettsiella grylli]|uniref:tRNA dimethylallyltransferase n=2 Tax=Rickettsiella grylli TaxID=59196 RepID=A8PLB7_9COXI|nr:tRNA delta(2)-isopentenylpyrophosphate transferase [Rickettsiella grylli]